MIEEIKNQFLNISNMFKNESTLENPDNDLIESLTFGNRSYTGVSVTEEKALQVAACYACVRILSTTFAALPLHLVRKQGDKTLKAKDHPLYEILHIMPNDEMVSYNHRQMIMSQILLKGTSYNEVARDGRGRVAEVSPLIGQMNVDRNKSGKLVYEFYDGKRTSIIPNSRMWRITGYSDNGIIGKTPLTIARETIGQAIAANQFGGKVFKNGARLSGVLKVVQKLNKEQRKDILKAWNDSYAGLDNAGKTGLVHNGADFKPVSMTSQDAQFLETLKFQRSEIAGFYGVPPHMIGDLERATFSNIEHQSIEFVIYSLLPYITNFEQTVYRDLLTPEERKEYSAKFSVEGLLRGDTKARGEFYRTLFNLGSLEIDEIRELENMNPVPGGKSRYMQTSMGKLDDNGNITGTKNENSQQTASTDSDESEGQQEI